MYMGGLYLGRNEKKAVFSFCLSLAIYNGQVTWRKELNKERVVTHCQSMTLCIELCAFPTHLQCISKALPHTLTHCVSDSALPPASTPLHCRLCLFVCLFTFVTSTCVACFVCL